jgi:Rrf2 family protein
MAHEPKLIYLTEALVNIAIKSPSGAVRGTDVCKNLGLPERYLEPEFQNLVRSGVLKSIRGPKGGYVLAREKRNISLSDINKALLKEKATGKFSKLASEVIVKKFELAEAELSKISLHDILQDAANLGLAKQSENSDFTI